MEQYFPMFCRLREEKLLLVGSNEHALFKLQKLLPFQPNITVIAAEPLSDFSDKVQYISIRDTSPEAWILKQMPKAVIVADETLVDIEKLYKLCVENRIEINTVDHSDFCTFLFPALLCRRQMTAAISTGGASPTVAVRLREMLERLLPSEIDDILDWLEELRPRVNAQTRLHAGSRKALYRWLTDEAFRQNRPLTGEETQRIIQLYLSGETSPESLS